MALSANTNRNLFGLTALSAWVGFGLSLVIEIFGWVKVKATDPITPDSQFGHVGNYADGLAGAGHRLSDLFSYFTTWSQIVVGIVFTLLWLKPTREQKWLKPALIDALIMITITGIVYNALIGPFYPPRGLNKLSSPIEHTLTPVLAIVVFLVAGPRGWFSIRAMKQALVLPIIYIFYTLIRGAFINQYPYDFLDVVSHGYMYVMIFILGILTFAILIMWIYMLIDRRLNRKNVTAS